MISVKEMREEDIEIVSKIEAECFSQPWSKQSFQAALHQNSMFLVAICEKEIVGYCGMYCSFEEGEITNVAVQKEKRGRHAATALMHELFKRAKKRGLNRILLEVRISNEAAVQLYRKMGFDTICIRKGFYAFPREDAFLMQKILK